eukprot:symbB.v1.2.027202.t1/scaffold2716.1/size72468/9
MPREVGHVTSAWRLKEAALEALQVKVAPELECSICCEMLSTKEVVALPCETRGCRSFFHTECIRPWLERNPSCPLCRDTLPQLVRPATPLPQGTGNPLLDLWFLAMAMQRQERENLTRHRQSNGPSLADLQGVWNLPRVMVCITSCFFGWNPFGSSLWPQKPQKTGDQQMASRRKVSISAEDVEVFTYVLEHEEVLKPLPVGCKWLGPPGYPDTAVQSTLSLRLEDSGHIVVLLAMSALLETLKYRPDFQSGTTTHEDFNSAEGKFGIPRFNGEATMLPEYTYRVRARAAKEKAMSKDEVEKLGPLG